MFGVQDKHLITSFDDFPWRPYLNIPSVGDVMDLQAFILIGRVIYEKYTRFDRSDY
jgi:hypothetical protein